MRQIKMNKIKQLCINCKHYSSKFIQEYNGVNRISYHTNDCNLLINSFHPVSGKIVEIPVECTIMRLGACGLEAKFFEEINK